MPSGANPATRPRIRIERLLDEADRRSALYDETFWSLRRRPKELPPVWLYDERGSRLFEQITSLPEYYLTGREQEILAACASEVAVRTEARTLVELGAGTCPRPAPCSTRSRPTARWSDSSLWTRAKKYCARVRAPSRSTIRSRCMRSWGTSSATSAHSRAASTGSVAFLGSTIGNLHPERRARLLAGIAATLEPTDAFLLGVDLVKDRARIEAAYNDSQGVTVSFVRNGLDVVNRELRADLDQELLAFEARWDEQEEWMDIGFLARAAQQVTFAELDTVVRLEQGEKLRLEVSTKFRREGIEQELAAAGMQPVAWWADEAVEFALLLATRNG